MAPPSVEKLPIPALKLGEGPHWDISSQSLYLVDIQDSKLVRFDSKTNEVYIAKLDIPNASFIIPIAGSKGQFVIASNINLYLVKWDGISEKVESLEHLYKLPNDLETNRINDGKCDPTGRLWFGTMKIENIFEGKNGKLYSFTKAAGIKEHTPGIGISNGLTWEGNNMYYIDTLALSIDVFDYNKAGIIKNRRKAFDFKEKKLSCYPDGMTIDKDGKIWLACYEGSQVLHIDPITGNIINKVAIPTLMVTSVAWGGPNLDELYVTSAENGLDGSGCTYRVTGLSTKGLPMNEFKL